MTFHDMTALGLHQPVIRNREAIEAEIHRLIEILDVIDGDADDLNENGDELDASYPMTSCRAGAAHEDDEDTHDREHDNADLEPSLGWTHNPNQDNVWWSHSGIVDGEEDVGDEGEAFADMDSDCDQEGERDGDMPGGSVLVAA